MAATIPMGFWMRQLLDRITAEGLRSMGAVRQAAKLAIPAFALIFLTGFAQYDRIDCIGPQDQLPVYRIHMQFDDGSGHASAVVVQDGYALTAYHAVSGQPAAVSLLTPEGPRAASVIAADPINDIALLAVDTSGISPLAFLRAELKPNRKVWVTGYAGEAGTSFSGPILAIIGGHLKIGAPVFPGMSGGAVITCDKGIPYVAGLVTSFNHRISRRWTQITPEQKQIFERVVNDGTSNGPSAIMLVWFIEYAVEMYESREQEQE